MMVDIMWPCTSNPSPTAPPRRPSSCGNPPASATKVRKRTLANLSHWPPAKIEGLRRALRGQAGGGDPAQALRITASLPHGHVQAVLGMIRRLGLDTLPGLATLRASATWSWP